MGVLDDVSRMKKEGLDEVEISDKLREQGVSPSEIDDAFHRMKIKNAISAENNFEVPRPENTMQNKQKPSGQFYTPRTKDIEENNFPNNGEEYYAPPEENESYQNYPPQQIEQQNPESYSPQYQQYDEYQPGVGGAGGAVDTDTVIEIAEQVFSEKTKKMQKQIDALNEFATLAQTKISNDNERLKRIERIIDNLQIKILEKIGDYGENISSVKKEMSMMQDSFSKILPKLAEAHSEHHHVSHTEHKKK